MRRFWSPTILLLGLAVLSAAVPLFSDIIGFPRAISYVLLGMWAMALAIFLNWRVEHFQRTDPNTERVRIEILRTMVNILVLFAVAIIVGVFAASIM